MESVDDAPTSPALYGLDKPARVTVWLGRDKDRSSRSLLVGRPVPEKKGVYVKRDGEPGVLLTAEAVWTTFPKTVAGLRDKTVVTYAYDQLTKVELVHPRGRVTLAEDGNRLELNTSEGLQA